MLYTYHPGEQKWIPQQRCMPASEFIKMASGQNETMRDNNIKKSSITQATSGVKQVPLPPSPPKIPVEKPKLAMTEKELLANLKNEVDKNEIFPPDILVAKVIGEFEPLMCPRTHALKHDAAPLLMGYAKKGCPVDCGEDWTEAHIIQMLKHGAHKSASLPEAILQLRKETKDKIKHGYARTVRWGDIAHNCPKKLKLSPVAMILHKSKAFRCILDLSFNLRIKGTTYPSVNETTNKKAKPEAMVQLGRSIQRIIATMADHKDKNKPFLFPNST